MEDDSKTLREQAKEVLRQGKTIDKSLYETDMKVLVEELSIYQIELEHQNQELIRSQEYLQHSNNRYLDLFDNAPIGYIIVDSSGIIKDINKTACLLLESSKTEFVETKISKIIHPDYQDIYYLYFRTLSYHKQLQPCDIKLRKSNNTYFYGRILGVLQTQDIDSEPEFRLAISDISIQKEMEINLLAAKERAEESDRLKSAFLANMSHEIRTPMNGILGFSELLKTPGLTGDVQQAYISIIGKSGKRMLNIINDIIDISKIEAGLMKLVINESNINEQVEYIYTFFKPEVEAKGMKLSLQIGLPGKDATIKTDREKIYSVLTNLVKNAIKYSNEGTIEIGNTLKTHNESVELEFYVKDTGIGIPIDRQNAIFERFIQADILDLQARQGAGLGLSISKAYVEMLGGNIWVKSTEGIGSTFYFTLPYNAGSTIETDAQQLAHSDNLDLARKLNILIAEDDDVSELLIEIYVKEIGKKIFKSRTGAEAIALCRQNPDIDLILMDIRMPGMDGYEAIREIRKFNKSVVIIAQTAFGLMVDRKKALEAGCTDYITKPIKKAELHSIIKKHFVK